MKKIEAILRPEKLDDVRNAIVKAGCSGIMISEIEGHGKQKGIVQQWRGERYKVELMSKVKIEVVVDDDMVNAIVDTIVKTAKTGEIGDGKIFITPVENVIRIRTGEKGVEAI